MGDQLLIHLATAMKNTLREGDTLARLGGDEFVAMFVDLDSAETCVPMLTRLLDAVALPVPLGDIALQVSASIGVTFYPQAHEMEADQLLRQADQAMYQAKLSGRNVAGASIPFSGCCQRISASAPITLPLCIFTLGW